MRMQHSHDRANVKVCWCLGCTPHWPGGIEISCLNLVATDIQPSEPREGQALQALQLVASEAQVRECGWQRLRQRLLPLGWTCACTRVGCCAAAKRAAAWSRRPGVSRARRVCYSASAGGHHVVGKQLQLLHTLDSAIRGAGEAKQRLVRALTAGTARSPACCRDRLRRAG